MFFCGVQLNTQSHFHFLTRTDCSGGFLWAKKKKLSRTVTSPHSALIDFHQNDPLNNSHFLTALIKTCMMEMDQMTVCNVKVAHSEVPTSHQLDLTELIKTLTLDIYFSQYVSTSNRLFNRLFVLNSRVRRYTVV